MKHPLLPLSETMHYILLFLREPSHGYAVMEKILRASEGKVNLAAGTIYGALDNLNKHGWIEPVSNKSGRRKVYKITAKGLEILKIEQQRLQHILSLYERSHLDEKN